ncbi:MAG: hypothetical protein IPM56_14900 [Ignavibacteriales bacterium]|nr:MAG: hypothetical protein IPM56_14900 [Ignavibacteriales bacterium]
MLAKILNITPGSGFKNSSKAPGLMKYIKGSRSSFISMNDSVNFSPAIQFLSRIEWQLKELSQTVNEKLLLTFAVHNIEFRVVIDISVISRLSFVTYEISRNRTGSSKEKTQIVITSILEEFSYDENSILLNLSALNILFDRYDMMNLTEELNGIDVATMSYLADDLANRLQSEFQYINKLLFIFIEKLTGKKVSDVQKKNNGKDSLIIIEKMKTINA